MCYEEYKTARKEMIEYGTAKQNVDKILALERMAGTQNKQKTRGQKMEP